MEFAGNTPESTFLIKRVVKFGGILSQSTFSRFYEARFFLKFEPGKKDLF